MMAAEEAVFVNQKMQKQQTAPGWLLEPNEGWHLEFSLTPPLTSVTDNGREVERSRGAICKQWRSPRKWRQLSHKPTFMSSTYRGTLLIITIN